MHNQQPPEVSLTQKRFFLFLAILALLAMILGWIATSLVGPGLASDSVIYLSVAQSLLDGKGLMMYLGAPLLSWPPLFSIVLAGASALLGVDVFLVAWFLNIFLLGVNLFLSGMVFWRVFQTRPIYAYLASMFVFLSISSLRVHATTFSEPLYIAMTLGLCFALDEYIRLRSRRALFFMVLLSALAPMVRYVGLAFAVAALSVIFIANRNDLRKFFMHGFVLAVISILPIGWWLILRNVMTYGTLFGTNPQTVDVVKNTSLGLTKMLHWFVPYLDLLMPILTRPFLLLVLLIALIGLANRRRSDLLHAWLLRLGDSMVYPVFIYGFVYFLAVVVTSITGDHKWLNDDDRYYVILLVPVMLLTLITLDVLILPHMKWTARRSAMVIALVFGVWSVYPLYGLREYLTEARELGEPSSYNLFNTRAYHEMGVIAELRNLRNAEPTAMVYANYTDAVWFYTRKPAQGLPIRGVQDVQTAYAGWPSEPGYIIWFKPNEYEVYLSPDELMEFATLQLIYTDPSGDIYFVSPR